MGTNEKMDEIVNILTDNGRKEEIDLKSLLNYLIKIHQPVLNESLEHGLDRIPQTMVSQDDLRKFIHQMYHFHAIFGLRHAHGIPEIIYQKEQLANLAKQVNFVSEIVNYSEFLDLTLKVLREN